MDKLTELLDERWPIKVSMPSSKKRYHEECRKIFAEGYNANKAYKKSTKAYVKVLCEIVSRLFPIKEDTVITGICEISENALYKGGIKKWAKDNQYIPFHDGRKLWTHGFGSVDQYLLGVKFCTDMESKSANL